MNKTSIKNYAIWARNELISRVSQKAFEYGVEKDNVLPYDAQSINGRLLSDDEKKKRQILINEVKHKGYDQVIEEVAYTWFNRFIALRFMEVNNYLPDKVRLFTNENNEFKPQIIDEALHIELAGLDKNKIITLKEANNNEELYKELLLATCNDMSRYLPGMFKPISDYMTLLFPSNLLREESVLGRLISDIDEDNWTDQVQIIGWLYQYYISEKHDQIVNIYKGTIKKEDIPAATQLFTTDWVVRYLVDNSLGRYWMERNPNSKNPISIPYYVHKNEDYETVNKSIQVNQITFFDPCMGSGHILVYAFDVFMQIYVSEGWTEREAAKSILQNNLYGLDIDERAYQLSYFALMMKARQYNRKILSEGIEPNVFSIKESNMFNRTLLDLFDDLKPLATRVLDTFIDAKEYGSILNIDFTQEELDSLDEKLNDIYRMTDYGNLIVQAESKDLINKFYPFLKQARIMSLKYNCVVTNPPYLNKYEGKLRQFLFDNYDDYSADLFSVFIKRNFDYSKEDGYLGFMTPFVWMFIKTYEKLRNLIVNSKSIITLCQMEYSAYEEATVPICCFVLGNSHSIKKGHYFRLSKFKGGMEVQKEKVLFAINNHNCGYYYTAELNDFNKIPNMPIAYWASERIFSSFQKLKSIGDLTIVRNGMKTGKNEQFVRLWFEVSIAKSSLNDKSLQDAISSNSKWYPYNKGGDYRKWYGNNDYVVNWENQGDEIFNKAKEQKRNVQNYPDEMKFSPSVTWSLITSSKPSFRYKDNSISDIAGMSLYNGGSKTKALLGFCNSCVSTEILSMLAPTINFQAGDIARLPVADEVFSENVIQITEECISISRLDWDSFETSWDFKRHPLVVDRREWIDQRSLGISAQARHDSVSLISKRYERWEKECTNRFNQLKTNEEELNRIFIDIYGLQDELTPEVEDKDITVRKADLQREIKSLISYAVGCMFGRYSLDVDGLAYAGGEWDDSKYKSYIPDKDNIIPICDDEYFNDDITGRFIEFIKVAYGEDTLEDNLRFIADALEGKGTSREVIRRYFINDFYNDHLKMYQKRPIYWQFDSGKKNGFKALIYIHRYTPDLIARMRTSYVHEQQSRYENQMSMIQNRIDSAISTSERVKAEKELKKLKDQADELRVYEEKIHHWADRMEPMDLDDGVKANYSKFQELFTKIK